MDAAVATSEAAALAREKNIAVRSLNDCHVWDGRREESCERKWEGK